MPSGVSCAAGLSLWGLSSAGRASALQAEGHRFDPDRLHHSVPGWIRSASAVCGVVSSDPDAFDNCEERETSEPLVPPSVGVTWGCRIAGPKAVLFQVKYTNQMSSCLTRHGGGKLYDFRPGARRGCVWVGTGGARRKRAPPRCARAHRNSCPSLDRIKREKGVWWMPWQQEAMKDVIPCDKQRGAGNGL